MWWILFEGVMDIELSTACGGESGVQGSSGLWTGLSPTVAVADGGGQRRLVVERVVCILVDGASRIVGGVRHGVEPSRS